MFSTTSYLADFNRCTTPHRRFPFQRCNFLPIDFITQNLELLNNRKQVTYRQKSMASRSVAILGAGTQGRRLAYMVNTASQPSSSPLAEAHNTSPHSGLVSATP